MRLWGGGGGGGGGGGVSSEWRRSRGWGGGGGYPQNAGVLVVVVIVCIFVTKTNLYHMNINSVHVCADSAIVGHSLINSWHAIWCPNNIHSVVENVLACTSVYLNECKNAGWETKNFGYSPELGSLLYSLYKIPLTQACFPLARPNFHWHLRAGEC